MCERLIATTDYRGYGSECNTTSTSIKLCYNARNTGTQCANPKDVHLSSSQSRVECPNHRDCTSSSSGVANGIKDYFPHVVNYLLSSVNLTTPASLNYLSVRYLRHVREFACLIPSPHFITWHFLIGSFSRQDIIYCAPKAE